MNSAPEIFDFLRLSPPFGDLDPSDVEHLAAATEVEFHLAGSLIFSQAQANEYLRVIRSGAVEIIHDGRVLDLIGEGEMFGHASMLSGFPTGFAARAAEDTLTYRIPAEVASGVLARPAGLRFVTRVLLEDPHGIRRAADPNREQLQQPVGSLLRAKPVVVTPDTTIREAARQMTAANATAVIVDLGDSVGIVTDRDLRSRVIASGLSVENGVSAAMTHPAFTVAEERQAGEVLLDMLDRGFRHFPVVSATGKLLGVVADSDLVAVQTRTSFAMRQAITAAATLSDLIEPARRLPSTIVAMHEAHIAALDIQATFSVVMDALTRRILELSIQQAGEPPVPFAWLALGSQARREAVPSSDIDSAIVWFDGAEDASIRSYFSSLAVATVSALEACGFHADSHRATASDPLFIRSEDSWRQAAQSWLEDPNQQNAIMMVSVLADSRPVFGLHTGVPVAEAFRSASEHKRLLRLLARLALAHKPPTGFLRGFVIEDSGEHRGHLDLKLGGIVPICDLARWAGMAAGVTSAPTTERLRAAGAAGTLKESDASTLQEAFHVVSELRLDHQIAQIVAGTEPDDFVNPSELSALTRSHLKEVFRTITSVQRRVANELTYS
ncbi:MAG TPA: putative nucleotidyltransferase substrate binding domain-containing protein [Acidimicrobiales bacterium]|nr:putative nucleotidyltransferase substrate binding domain-containing protein [Acidimicrobiales bacterium]